MLTFIPCCQRAPVEALLTRRSLELWVGRTPDRRGAVAYGAGPLEPDNVSDLVMQAGRAVGLAVVIEPRLLTAYHEVRAGLGALLRACCHRWSTWDLETARTAVHLGLEVEMAEHPGWIVAEAGDHDLYSSRVMSKALAAGEADVPERSNARWIIARGVGGILLAATLRVPCQVEVGYEDGGRNEALVRLNQELHAAGAPVFLERPRGRLLEQVWPQRLLESKRAAASAALERLFPARAPAAAVMDEVLR